jgi:hypothetical protein
MALAAAHAEALKVRADRAEKIRAERRTRALVVAQLAAQAREQAEKLAQQKAGRERKRIEINQQLASLDHPDEALTNTPSAPDGKYEPSVTQHRPPPADGTGFFGS